jgi:hypothetical protein
MNDTDFMKEHMDEFFRNIVSYKTKTEATTNALLSSFFKNIHVNQTQSDEILKKRMKE